MSKKYYVMGLALLSLITTSCAGTNFDNSRLVVGLEADYAPFNWTATESNEHTLPLNGIKHQYADGYDVKVARYLSEYLSIPVIIKKIAWESLVPALKTRDINAIIAGMSYSKDRDRALDFTNPYYVSDLVAVVRANSSLVAMTSIQDLSGYKVISQRHTIQDTVIDQIHNVIHVPVADSFALGAQSLLVHDADALIAEYPVARSIVNANESLNLVTFKDGFSGVDENELGVSVAVDEGNIDLLTRLNEALDNLSKETQKVWMDGALERASL